MSEDWEISDEQWQRDPSEAHQARLDHPLPGDDSPIRMTAYEAEKCLSIIRGYLDGMELYLPSLELVAQLLSTRALTAKGIPHAIPDPSPQLAQTPWPPPPDLRRPE